MHPAAFDGYTRFLWWTYVVTIGASIYMCVAILAAKVGPQDPYFDPAMLFVVPVAAELHVFLGGAIAGISLYASQRPTANRFLGLGMGAAALGFGTLFAIALLSE